MRVAQVLTLAAVAVSAQTTVQEYDSSLDMEINAGAVDTSIKSDWCRSQTNSCDTLCDNDSSTNDCSIQTLEYDCTCGSNNSAPGLQYYQGTMPTFICKELFSQCIAENTSSARAQEACKSNIDDLCGTLDTADVETGDDDDEEGDDQDDASETSETTTASTPENTGGSNDSGNNDDSQEQDDDNLALSVSIPQGMAALAAVGVIAALA